MMQCVLGEFKNPNILSLILNLKHWMSLFPVYLLQPSLVFCELLQLVAVPHTGQLPPQAGGRRERYGETRGRRPAFDLRGLGQRQALDAADGACVGEPVLGVGLGGRKGGQGPAGRRGRRSRGTSDVLRDGGAIGAGLAQDLKVLGCFVVLLVELGSIWEARGERGWSTESKGKEM